MPRLATALALALALPAAPVAGAGLPGEALFTQGARPGAASPRATVAGGAVLPATALPCAGCHGADGGGGRAEAGVRPPPVTWSALSRATGERPAYDPATLFRALALGQAAGGRMLDPAMPRYALTLEDGEALLAWLRALDSRGVPGVDEARLRLGLLLPAGPGGAAFAAAFEAALAAAAPAGIFGRAPMVVPAVAEGAAAAEAAARRLLAEGPLFLVSALPEAETAAVLAAARPERAPLLTLQAGAVPTPLGFALLPGAVEEGLALLRRLPEPGQALLAVGEGEAPRQVAERLAERLEAETGAAPRLVPLSGLAAAAPGAAAVLLLGAPEALPAAAAALRDSRVPVLLPGSVGGVAAGAVAAVLGRPVLVGLGLPPGGGSGPAAARFAATAAAQAGLAGRLGHAAGEVVVEALRRAGRGVTRERLLAALAEGEPFEPGALPALRLSGGPRGGGAVRVVQVDGEGRAWRAAARGGVE